MRNLKVKAFRNFQSALDFLTDNGCNTTVQYIDKLITDGYCQYKRWHIVIDHDGEIEATKPIVWKRVAPALSNFFNGWRAKK